MTPWHSTLELVSAHLVSFSTWLTHSTASDLILRRAQGIEKAVLQDLGGTTAAYKSKIRSLFVNLKDKNNPDLRERVVSGELAAEKLSKMTSQVRLLNPHSRASVLTRIIGNGIGRTPGCRQQNQRRKLPQFPRRRRTSGRDGCVPVWAVQTGKCVLDSY